MSLAVLSFLKPVFNKLPPGAQVHVRKFYGYADLRSRAVTSRRAVFRGNRVEFLDVEIANLEPYEFLGPGPGEVLVETLSTLVSPGTETAVLCALPGVPRGMFPFPPGYSAVGIARAVGRGVDGIRVGQRVAGRLSHASRGLMSSISLFAVPDEVTNEQASFIELGIITLQGIRRARITPGDRVAVVGQGLIGQISNRLARVCGAAHITAVASSRNRSAGALRDGHVDSFVALKENPRLQDIAADIVIEAVGTPGAVMTAMSCARDGGTVVLLGSARGLGRNLDVYTAAQSRRITLVGAHISVLPDREVSPGRYTYAEEGRLFLELLRTGRLELADLITWRAKPSECNAVYEVLARGGEHHVGILFDWKNFETNPAPATGR
jgi:threonine dehydrogenase-like Zn-dependent dehydrogenase